jgi:isopentenyl diphosphate isomerase/L-lactate dehydrogenase-like FMN-dependent dehydrogenase|tara:strand:+ start:334 stop:555 length:222 start_codon:yes stop_codon:yes gene_type:complete
MQVNTLINWISGLVSWLAAISSVALIVTIMSDFTVLADSGIENIAEGIEVIALIGAKIVGGFYLMLVAIFLKR